MNRSNEIMFTIICIRRNIKLIVLLYCQRCTDNMVRLRIHFTIVEIINNTLHSYISAT